MKRPRFSLLTLFLAITIASCFCGAWANNVLIAESGDDALLHSRRIRCGLISIGCVDRPGDGHGWLFGMWWYVERGDAANYESPLVEVSIPWSKDGFPSGRVCSSHPRHTG